ncbi:polysaccharide biosynthesis/export family protein [Flavobacteriales bacterium]|jgi:polysaccharide biosynthesis/export protein|nr:polysaccharide biosynthesis/export family protein [Flavobacteriales bacterium]|tara:strand:- start:159 stop:935 length:777 start_codon:yes stop_codon:yes gene_type:complete
MKNFQIKYIFILSIISCLIFSCTPVNKITYINNNSQAAWDISPLPPKHHIEIGDILMVKVISRNDESNKIFNLETNTNNSNTTTANLYLNGFTINREGSIDLPKVGRVVLLNQTLEQAKETIMQAAIEYLIDPYVIVKLANFEVTVLGEVNMPGAYPVYKENLTIFDALAMAGDINDYGNLRKVKIVRSKNNKKEVSFIDLTDSKILSSNYYYLNNKDLVYVQPLKFKGLKKSQSQLFLSSLTTFAVLFNAYLNFNKD